MDGRHAHGVILLVLLLGVLVEGSIDVYVSPDGSNSTLCGSSYLDACGSLPSAFKSACAQQNGTNINTTVWVTTGEYYLTEYFSPISCQLSLMSVDGSEVTNITSTTGRNTVILFDVSNEPALLWDIRISGFTLFNVAFEVENGLFKPEENAKSLFIEDIVISDPHTYPSFSIHGGISQLHLNQISVQSAQSPLPLILTTHDVVNITMREVHIDGQGQEAERLFLFRELATLTMDHCTIQNLTNVETMLRFPASLHPYNMYQMTHVNITNVRGADLAKIDPRTLLDFDANARFDDCYFSYISNFDTVVDSKALLTVNRCSWKHSHTNNSIISLGTSINGEFEIENCEFQDITVSKEVILNRLVSSKVNLTLSNVMASNITALAFLNSSTGAHNDLYVKDSSFTQMSNVRVFDLANGGVKVGESYFSNITFSDIQQYSHNATDSGSLASVIYSHCQSVAHSLVSVRDCTFTGANMTLLVGRDCTVLVDGFTASQSIFDYSLINFARSNVTTRNMVLTSHHVPQILYFDESTALLSETTLNQNVYGEVAFVMQSSDITIDTMNITNSQSTQLSSSFISLDKTTLRATSLYAVHNDAENGLILCSTNSALYVEDSAFSNNTAVTGAALYLVEECSATVDNCQFEHNSVENEGGAIWLGGLAHGDIARSSFYNNYAARAGGAIRVGGNATASLHELELNNNSALQGGCFYSCDQSVSTLTQVNMTSCTALTSGGGMIITDYAEVNMQNGCIGKSSSGSAGSAIFANGFSVPTFDGVLVEANYSPNQAAGIYLADRCALSFANGILRNNVAMSTGAVIVLDHNSTASIHNCTFSDNVSSSKGGVFACFNRAAVNITNSTMMGNTASSDGVAHISDSAHIRMIDCEIFNNSARSRAGFCSVSSHATLYALRIRANYNVAQNGPGGAIVVSDDAVVQVYDSEFSYNTASAAGAVYTLTNREFYAWNTVFHGNSAYQGGALSAAEGSTITLVKCNCTENSAQDTGDGGCLIVQDHSILNLSFCYLEGNSGTRGGAVLLEQVSAYYGKDNVFYNNEARSDGGAILVESTCSLYEEGTLITFNSAGNGGALFLVDGNAYFEGVTIEQNSAQWGGGIFVSYTHSSSPQLLDVVLRNNSAKFGGGGLYLSQVSSDSENIVSNTTLANGADYNFVNLTVQNNTATSGAGIYIERLEQDTPSFDKLSIQGNNADNWGGGIFFGSYSTSYPIVSVAIFSDNRAAFGGGNVGFMDLSSPSNSRDFCANCTYGDSHAIEGYQDADGFATLPLMISTICPTVKMYLNSEFNVSISVQDAFGTVVVGAYLVEYPIAVDMTQDDDEDTSAYVHARYNTTQMVDSLSGLAMFEYLTVCINVDTSSADGLLIFDATTNDPDVIGIIQATCKFSIASCKNEDDKLVPSDTTECGYECKSTISAWFIVVVLLLCLMLVGCLLCTVVGSFFIWKYRERIRQLRYEALEFPDFRLGPAITLADILDDPAINRIPWNQVVIGESIGKGASGLVRKGRWERPNGVIEEIALKELLLGFEYNPEALSDFIVEIKYLSGLKHKNIVNFMGILVPPDDQITNLYLVTELMHYGSVRDLLDRKGANLPLSMRVRLSLDAARGVEHLHKKKLIHRDLKPQNLLVNRGWVCKVSDFGVSTVRPTITRAMTCIGTPVYMAPEVLSKNKYSEKADVYSFGILLYELFTGYIPYTRPPYDDMNQAQLMLAILEENARPSLTDLHPALAQLIQDCWNVDASLRPTISELIVRLRRLKVQYDTQQPRSPSAHSQDPYPVPDQLEKEELDAMKRRMKSTHHSGELELPAMTDEDENYYSDQSEGDVSTPMEYSPPQSTFKKWFTKQKYTI